MQGQEEFLSSFRFNPAHEGHVIVERNLFLVDERSGPVPKSPRFLETIRDHGAWTHGLSACQVKHRTPRLQPTARLLNFALHHGIVNGREDAAKIGCRLAFTDVAPENTCLDLYPGDEWNESVKQRWSPGQVAIACRLAGTTIRVSMGSLKQAIEYRNRLITILDELIREGDCSHGKRMHLYLQAAGHCRPVRCRDIDSFCQQAMEPGPDQGLRDYWELVHIGRQGAIEIRCFGVTENNGTVVDWVEACLSKFPS